MLKALRHNLGGLFQLSGRTGRQDFWLYAMVVGLGAMGVWTTAAGFLFSQMFGRIRKFAAEHPELVRETRGPGSYSVEVEGFHPQLAPDFTIVVPLMGAIVVVVLLLLTASVVRRLHDSGRAGWWGLPPVILLGCGLGLMAHVFASMTREGPDVGLFFVTFFINLAYLVTLLLLTVQLARAGSPGPNRYGDVPG